MKLNEGMFDRVVRVVVGVVLLYVGIAVLGGVWGVVVDVVAVLLLVTGAVGVCPAYLPFRLSTKK